MSSLDFIKKHLSEEQFSKLKSTILNSSKSHIKIGRLKFFITRNRISGKEIVSFLSEENFDIDKKILAYSPKLTFDSFKGIIKGYFRQNQLNLK